MKVYIAAKLEDGWLAKELRWRLSKFEIETIERWPYQTEKYSLNAAESKRDLEDIDMADAVVLLLRRWSPGLDGTGGRYFEAGWACHAGKPILMVGRAANPFVYIPEQYGKVKWLEVFESSEPSVQSLDRLAERIVEGLNELAGKEND